MTESTTPAEKGSSFGPRRPKKRALTIGIAVGALGLVALGSTAAFAATPSSTPTSSATPLHSTSTDAPSTDAPRSAAPRFDHMPSSARVLLIEDDDAIRSPVDTPPP
ncbi:hypothetical protein C5C56_16920, partial [Rathayibacter sp. AY1D1]|uniref:hypothetical protein n=1 Tax=Rathayibacter sp. AY1D1 TaxID=2080542 RepID=UPI000CE8F213